MLYRNDFSEKRDFQRMDMECPMSFCIKGDSTMHQGTAKNLSASGLSLLCSVEVAEGSQLDVTIAPEPAIVPPLRATCTVTRVDSPEPGKYELGVQISEIHPVEADQT